MRLLLISNSTNAGEKYLDYPKHQIKDFLAKSGVKKVLFIPFAAVTFSFEEYRKKVAERLAEVGIEVESVVDSEDMIKAVEAAEAVVVGGGNTFQLVRMMQESGVMEAIVKRAKSGMPYIGWSAGSNVACPTLCTTNDMPICEPISFNTMNLIPFQINPHYTDFHPEGHAGETRDQRLAEFLAANKEVTVAGLREGCMLVVEGESLKLIGPKSLRIFEYGKDAIDYCENDSLDFLLKLNTK